MYQTILKACGAVRPRSIQSFHDELAAADLSEEVALSQIADSGRTDILPMVIIYPEASVYGPVKPEDVKRIVEEHLL